MRRLGVLLSSIVFVAPSASALDRLLALDRWQNTGPNLLSIAKLDLYDPLAGSTTIYVSNQGTLWSQPAPVLDVHSLAVHPVSGQIYTVARMQSIAGVINAMVAVNRDTGALSYVGAPSQTEARFRFHPVTLAFHWVSGKQSRTYTAPGGSNVFNPDLFFPAGDGNAGASPFCAGFAFEPPMIGDDESAAYLLDATTDSLCIADFATGELRTIGSLGVDLTGLVAGPVVELGGEIFFAADFGLGPRLFAVDRQTGAATDAGEFPSDYGITDLALERITDTSGDLDGDGYPDRVEVAGGSSPGDSASSPFDGFPVAPAVTVEPLLSKSLAIELDFAEAGADELLWKGRVPVASDFVAHGQRWIVEIGGHATEFTLGKKGKAKALAQGLTLELGKKVKNGSLPLKVKAKHASLASLLEDDGLIDADLVATPVVVPLRIWMPGVTFGLDVTLSYSAVAGDSGIGQ